MISPNENPDLFTALVVAGWVILLGSVVLIWVRALSSVLSSLFFDDDTVRAHKEASRGTLVDGVDLFGEWTSATVGVVSQGIVYAFSVFWFFFSFFLLAASLHIVYLYFPITIGSFTESWNDNVGGVWFTYVVGLLETMRNAFERVVGIYNIAVFVLFKLPLSIVLHMLSTGFGDVLDFGEDIGRASVSLVESLGKWGDALGQTCDMLPGGVIDNSCYDPAMRQLDVITPLSHVNRAVLHVVDFIPRTCTVLAFPSAMVLYPLTDIELSRAVHWAINAIVHFCVTGPVIASKHFAATQRIALMVPDWAPCFDYTANALVHLGRCLDNWLDIVFYMLVTLIDPELAVSCDVKTGSWDFASDATLLGSFGANKTVITSLTPSIFAITDGYSVEYHLHGRRGGIRTRINAWPIPVNISYGVAAVAYTRDLSRDETGSGHTTALFACMCTDRVSVGGQPEGIEVRCAIVPFEPVDGLGEAAFVVDMGWEIANTPRRMQCRDTKISVQSIRFQSQRLTTPTGLQYAPALDPPVTCMSLNTCTRIDAAVWVMPVCPLERPTPSQNARPPGGDGACLRGLKDFSCFPYCLGVHRSFAANERIIIRSSSAWERNVLLTSRDCVLENPTTLDERTSEEAFGEAEDATGTWVPNTALGGQMAERKIKASGTGEGSCRINRDAISSVPQLVDSLYTSTQMFVELFAFDKDRTFAADFAEDLYRFNPTDAMLLERQPFVFAGDFALSTSTYCRSDTAWDYSPTSASRCTQVVDVVRLTGNEFNEFTIRHLLPYGLPVTRRPLTITDTSTVIREGYVTLPPVLVRSVYLHNPATSTRDAVWYGVNPDYEMLHCMLRYCSGFEQLVNCLQFSVLSNYELLRIWKLIPQAGCTRLDTGEVVCPPQVARSIVIDDEFAMRISSSPNFDFADFCDEDMDRNMYIEHMEAFDPLNVIVSVRRGNAQALYQELWGGGGPSTTTPRAKTVHYFINVQTLELRENTPWTETPAIIDQAGFLCKEMRIMPSIGSWSTESMAAVVFLFKMPVMLLLHLPSLYELFFDAAERCELEHTSRRHSFYEECGTQTLDLTDFFGALHRANVHAWSLLDSVANILGLVSDHESIQAVQTFLSGAQMYSENQVMLGYTSVTASASKLIQANVAKGPSSGGAEAPGGMPALYFAGLLHIGTPQFMSGMNVGVVPIVFAEYSYRVFTRVVDRLVLITSLAVRGGPAVRIDSIYYNISSVIYESIRTDWDELMNVRSRRACAGVSLMVGYTNPWARFLRHWCLAGVEFSDGVVKSMGSFLVEVPLTVCVCIESNEHNFVQYLSSTCAPRTAPSLRPLVVSLLAWSNDVFAEESFETQDLMKEVCGETMLAFEESLMHMFTPWALEHQLAAKATVELFDSLGILLGGESGNCMDFENNPYVSVMIPTPIDYFRVCGGTSACTSRCKAFSDNLQREIDLRNGDYRQPPMQFSTSLESKLFSRFGAQDYQEEYLSIVALTELPPSNDGCSRCRSNESDCVGVVGMTFPDPDGEPGTFRVRSYCVPYGFGEFVFMGHEWVIADSPGAPVSTFLDPRSINRVLRMVFSVPYGDHVLMLSEVQNHQEGELYYTQRFQRITAWRSSQVLHTQQILNSGTLKDRCEGAITAGLEAVYSSAVDEETGQTVLYTTGFVKGHILDFFPVVSDEFTVDLVVKVHAFFFLSMQGKPSLKKDQHVYLRVGWCEYLPGNFAGKRRPTMSRCDGVKQSGIVCEGVGLEFGQALYDEWLVDGNFMYLPDEAVYTWVPSARVSMGSLPHILPAHINISARVLDVDIRSPRVALRGSTAGADILGARGYVQVTPETMTPGQYNPLTHSPIAHWAPDNPASYNTPSAGTGMWYKTAGTVLARSWLMDVRYDERLRLLRGVPARKKVVQVQVERYCNGHSCSGCSTLRLRQFCVALQTCIISNCAGLVVNQGDILCNLGLRIEALYSQATGMYIAVWHALVSIMLSILESQSHIRSPSEVRVEWFSDLFYTMTCESKDVLASLTGLIAAILHRGTDLEGVSDEISGRSTSLVNYDLRNSREINSDAYNQKALQVAAMHQLLFQIVLYPLYNAFAVHRYIVCTVDNIVSVSSEGKFNLSLGAIGNLPPGTEGAAGKWGVCSNQAAIEQIIEGTNTLTTSESLTRVLDSMANDDAASADFASLASSVISRGLYPYNLALQYIDSTAAWAMGVVTGFQDLMYNNDDPECQLSDISVSDGVQCACGDTPAYVIPERRVEGVGEGGFWCAGVLHVALDDGSFAYVYNPYSLAELGEMLQDMDTYLSCISESDPDFVTSCKRPESNDEFYASKLEDYTACLRRASSRRAAGCVRPTIPAFDRAGVNPMTILTRCRSNYLQQQWDPSASFLFQEDFQPHFAAPGFQEAQKAAREWAAGMTPELAECVTTHAGLSSFSSCLSVFLRGFQHTLQSAEGRTLTGMRSETYFAYRQGRVDEHPSTNPDACILYTGPASSPNASQETQDQFRNCLADKAGIDESCELPALAWAGRQHSRTPVASVHREAVVDPEKRVAIAENMYQAARQSILRAFEAFDYSSLDALDVLFFSAEGDILHQMMDCMFMGPYARLDYVVTDADGTLPPLRWYRDSGGGETRDFDLPCSGDKLHGDDEGPPFTCGSPARRALIKKYVRDYMFGSGEDARDASEETARLVRLKLDRIRAAYSDVSLYGCRGADGSVSVSHCGDPLYGGQGFKPALPPFGQINTTTVAAAVFRRLPLFFRDALTDIRIWGEHYTDDVHTQPWGRWRGNEIALETQLFSPHRPIVSYNASETFDAALDDPFKSSVWGLCTSLLSQPMLTIPLQQYAEDGSANEDAAQIPHWMPKGLREGRIPRYSSFDNAPPSVWMGNFLREAWFHSPMYMHYVVRHVPSASKICEEAATSDMDDEVNSPPSVPKPHVQPSHMYLVVPAEDGEGIQTRVTEIDAERNSLPFHSFHARSIGAVRRVCPCGSWQYSRDTPDRVVRVFDRCLLSSAACDFIVHNAVNNNATAHSFVYKVCFTESGEYQVSQVPRVLEELRVLFPEGVGEGCPEFTLSDQWGIFPFSDANRLRNAPWAPTTESYAGTNITLDSSNLLARRPLGLSPSSLGHVRSETAAGRGWTHGTRKVPLANARGKSVAQERCEKMRNRGHHHDIFTSSLIDDFFDELFPVAQLVREPAGVSACTRYVLERFKLYFATHVIRTPNTQELRASVGRWATRCELKAKQNTVCNALGVYNVVPARSVWLQGRAPDCRYEFNMSEWDMRFGSSFYVTPSCMLYVDGDLYDLHRCWDLSQPALFLPEHLSPRCLIRRIDGASEADSAFAQNPTLMTGDTDPTVLYWGTGEHLQSDASATSLLAALMARQDAVQQAGIRVDISKAFINTLFDGSLSLGVENDATGTVFGNTPPSSCQSGTLECGTAEFCDHVFDWWPDTWQDPPGYHPTAACSAEDNAFRTFDSYMSVDRERMRLVYQHTSLRSSKLHYQWGGAGGLCRLHSINQPLIETNTHRVCTQPPLSIPNPALPLRPGWQRAPVDFGPEECAARSSDVPWTLPDDASGRGTVHPQMRTVGGVNDLLRVTSEPGDVRQGRRLASTVYPALSAMLQDGHSLVSLQRHAQQLEAIIENKGPVLPRAGIIPELEDENEGSAQDPWAGCVPPQEPVQCAPGEPNACPQGMQCVRAVEHPEEFGICLSVRGITPPAQTPCYRSDMCPETSHCLAEGVCGGIQMHLWNIGDDPIEFTTLNSDTCGVDTDDANEQTFQGASPWETVPDVLQTSGMCAQRHAYGYLYNTEHRLDEKHADHGFMRLRQDTLRMPWAWVQQTPSGRMLSEDREAPDIERDTRTLHVHPHVCDHTLMHMEGFKVCSGVNGDRGISMTPYDVERDSITGRGTLWAAESWRPGAPTTTALEKHYWLRTSDPADPTKIRVNTIFASEDFRKRGAFAFLGGDARASAQTYEGAVGRSQTHFLRCVNIDPCGLPEYSFSGRIVPQRVRYNEAVGDYVPVTLEDYNLCGSIGFVRGDTRRECNLDVDLFPHVRLVATGSSSFCMDLFGAPSTGAGGGGGIDVVVLVASITDPCSPGVVCCNGVTDASVVCKYVAIGNPRDGLSHRDVHNAMLTKLNNIMTLVTTPHVLFELRQTTIGLGTVVECLEDLSETNARFQGGLRQVYGTQGHAGLYYALGYLLYEVPVLWYYKWIYRTLVFPEDATPLSVTRAAAEWDGIIDLRESWTSRTDSTQSVIRRCRAADCICQQQMQIPSLRDRLICLNAGVRLRLQATLVPGANAQPAPPRFYSDALDEYLAAMRRAIMQKVLDFIRSEFAIDPDEPNTYVPGCYKRAFWNRTRVVTDPYWQTHLTELIEGKHMESGPNMPFDPTRPENEEYFEFAGFEPATSANNVLSIIQDIVESYEFLDMDFDAVRDGSLFQRDDITTDGVVQWYYPIFRLRSAPGLTTEHDNADDEQLNGVRYEPTQSERDDGTFECVFQDETFHPLENLGDPNVFDPPMVFLGTHQNDRFGEIFGMDICNTAEANFVTVDIDAPGYEEYENPVMSCAFEDSQKKHGNDVCDATITAKCEHDFDIDVKKAPGLFETLAMAAVFVPYGAIAVGVKHGVESAKNYKAEMKAKTKCVVSEFHEFPGAQAPTMQCDASPAFTKRCTPARTADEYRGYWDDFIRIPFEYEHYFSFDDDRWDWLKDGTQSPFKIFRDTSASSGWENTLGRGADAAKAWAQQIQKEEGGADSGSFTLTCMMRSGVDLEGITLPSFFPSNVLFPRAVRPEDPLPQAQPLHSMCHRVNSACTPEGLRPDFVRNGNCRLRYAQAPPGVAMRFFGTQSDPDRNTAEKGFPLWAWCPHDPEQADGKTRISGAEVTSTQKSRRRHYPGMQGHSFSCTSQFAGDSGQSTTCDSDADEDDCYIVSASSNSEWFFEKTRPQCQQQSGACSYSLTLAEGFFCGTGELDNSGNIVPPPTPCPAGLRKTLVRGAYTGQRSLWKCTPCLKFNPLRFEGRLNCGLPRGSDGTSRPLHTREVVAAVKSFISQEVHSVEHFQRIHNELGLLYNGRPDTLRYDADQRMVFAPLQPLSFADDFDDWEGSADGECSSSLTADSGDVDPCTWSGYDITSAQERDRFYTRKPENLVCTNEIPSAAEYMTCSNHSNEPRNMLNAWVNDHYRVGQGPWLPVLPARKGVSWAIDRSAVSNPFTFLFLSNKRPDTQVYARSVLGEKVCRAGTQLYSICAQLPSGKYVHVNPWPAGEFNIYTPEAGAPESAGVMGLDQCRRVSGAWETCCTCFPKSMCCFPDEACGEGGVPEEHEDNLYTRPGHSSACTPREFHEATGQPRPRNHPSNICGRDPFAAMPSVCTHHQGIVGAGTGDPLGGLRELYHEITREGPTTSFAEDFLVAAEPVLWAGGLATDSTSYSSPRAHLLRMPDHLMYPAHLVLVAGQTGARMRMHGAQMQRNGGTLYQGEHVPGLHTWVAGLQGTLALEHARVARLYPGLLGNVGTPSDPWTCPLRTIAFWGQDSPGFNPLVPDPVRSDFMFGGKYYCREGIPDPVEGGCMHGLHPYHAPREFRGIRNFYTTDGRCYFDLLSGTNTVPASATIDSSDSTHPCGLMAQLRFILDGAWHQSHIVPSVNTACDKILDWPQQRFPYRSGEPDARGSSDDTPQSCALLQRVTPFRIRIKNTAPLLMHPSATTADEGGDCHMGRATCINATEHRQLREYEHCITIARTSTQAHIRCTGRRLPSDGRANAADRLFAFERELRLHPQTQIVDGPTRRRKRCSECDAPDMPHYDPADRPMPHAETSSGVIRRVPAKRSLARELAKMCEQDEACEVNSELWVDNDAFLDRLLNVPKTLLKHSGGTTITQPLSWEEMVDELPPPISDESLWDIPWVLYNNNTATGAASKTAWKTDRYRTCWGVVRKQLEDDPGTFVRPISLCDLTGPLQELCTTLANARADIESANCIAQGDACEVLSSFYTPAQWFVTNKAFARETVRDFYRFQASDACQSEEDRLQRAHDENELVKKTCIATQLELVKEALQFMRLIARMILSVSMSALSVAVDLFLMVIYASDGKDLGPLLGDAMYHLENILRLALESVKQMLNLFLNLIASIGGGAKFVADLFYTMCKIVTMIMHFVVEWFLCITFRTWVAALFEVIDTVTDAINALAGAFNAKVDMQGWQNVKNSVSDFFESLPCVTPNPLKQGMDATVVSVITSPVAVGNAVFNSDAGCSYPQAWTDESSYGHAFLPTRCWANPSQGDLLGTSNTLGCSASDTCIRDGFGEDIGVCEGCQAVDPFSFSRFGCDLLLKKCRCGVPIQAKTACLRNADCAAQVPCALYGSAGGASYGVVDCMDSCRTQAVCLLRDTATNGIPPLGQCACLLEQPRIHSCDNGGMLVNMAVQRDMCFVALDHSLGTTIGTYTTEVIQQSALALAPCALLSRNEEHLTCQSVQSTLGVVSKHIVASSFVSLPDWGALQRRLLWETADRSPAGAWEGFVPKLLQNETLEWADTGVCEELVTAHRNGAVESSVTDRATLLHCLKWRSVLYAAKLMYRLENVDDRALVSWRHAFLSIANEIEHRLTAPGESLSGYASAIYFCMSQVDGFESLLNIVRRLVIAFLRWWDAVAPATPPAPIEHTPAPYPGLGEQSAGLWQGNATAVIGMYAGYAESYYRNLSDGSWTPWRSLLTHASILHVETSAADPPFPRTLNVSLHSRKPPPATPQASPQPARRLLQQTLYELGNNWPVNWAEYRAGASVRSGQPICELWDVTTESVSRMYTSTRDYYENGFMPRENISHVIRDNVMHVLPLSNEERARREELMQESSRAGVPQADWTSFSFNTFADAVEYATGLRTDDVVTFFAPGVTLQEQVDRDAFTLQRIMFDAAHCDTHRIMLCTAPPRSLIATIIICMLGLWLLCTVLYLSTAFTAFLWLVVLPWVVMWYAYGFSPTCFPMIPTCLMKDVVVAANRTFPANVQWPSMLIRTEECALSGVPFNESLRGKLNCFHSCANEQLGFRSWEDPVAWFLCSIDEQACQSAADFLSNTTGFAGRYADATRYFREVIHYADVDATTAHHICATLTLFYVVPVLLLAIWLVLMASVLVRTFILLMFKTIVFLLNVRSVRNRDM